MSRSTGLCWMEGRYLEADEARLSVDDLAVVRGFGVFDFLRTYGRQPFNLPRHWDRLVSSGRRLGLESPLGFREAEEVIREGLRRYDRAETGIRIILTGGVSDDGAIPVPGRENLLFLFRPLKIYPEELYRDGAAAITVDDMRVLPEAKTIDYLNALIHQRAARERGAVEAIYAPDGRILEGTTTNLFLVAGGTIKTPGKDVLEGITRSVVLEIAEKRFPTACRDVFLNEAREADEIFITATNKEVMPITKLDGNPVGEGRPGPVTREIMRVFREQTRGK